MNVHFRLVVSECPEDQASKDSLWALSQVHKEITVAVVGAAHPVEESVCVGKRVCVREYVRESVREILPAKSIAHIQHVLQGPTQEISELFGTFFRSHVLRVRIRSNNGFEQSR